MAGRIFENSIVMINTKPTWGVRSDGTVGLGSRNGAKRGVRIHSVKRFAPV
jgi:hypothetical protein